MAIFYVRKPFCRKNRNLVRFHGREEDSKDFLKPDEIGRAILSEPIDFQYDSGPGYDIWPRFGASLERLVTQAQESQSLGLALKEQSGKGQYRVILCSDKPVQREESKQDDDLVQRTMKLKMVSNIPLEASRQQKEQGCLVQLACLCGPQNVNVRIKCLGSSTQFPWMEEPCILVWNEEDLSWETEVQLTFVNEQLAVFGGTGDDNPLYILLSWITSKIEADGMKSVLQRLYSGPGDNWKMQKQLLEQGTFSDLVVISGNPKNETNPRLFKCHRVKLAEASPVFADMLQGNWEEAQTRTIKLPESEDAIEAMLHFIYYGGTDRIYQPCETLVLELLQAGHKYDILNLVDVAALTIHARECTESSVEVALQTFCFVRKVDGQLWTELREKCYSTVLENEKDSREQSKCWGKLVQIAKKLGPGFVSVLENIGTSRKYTRKLLPGSLDGVKGLEKEETGLFYDFLVSGDIYVTCDIAVGLFMLAKYLGKSVKEVEKKIEDGVMYDMQENKPLRCYQVDYLVEVFCLARNKEGEFWVKMKTEAVKKLKEYQTKQPKKIEASLKFKEMIEGNGEVAEDFISFKAALELQEKEEEQMRGDSNKRRRLN